MQSKKIDYLVLVLKLVARFGVATQSAMFYTFLILPFFVLLYYIPGGIQMILVGSGKFPITSLLTIDLWKKDAFSLSNQEAQLLIGSIIFISAIIDEIFQRLTRNKFQFSFKKKLLIVIVFSLIEYPIVYTALCIITLLQKGQPIILNTNYIGILFFLSALTTFFYLWKTMIKQFFNLLIYVFSRRNSIALDLQPHDEILSPKS